MQELATLERTLQPMQNPVESKASAVSWAAILAGAIAAVATSLILALIAAGLDLASLSPWAGRGASATTVTVMTAIALLVNQWLSAAMGGYLTGRLRTKWMGVHTHEVFFRDTAHGFLTWAVATVIVVSIVASGASAVMGVGARDAGIVASGVTSSASSPISGSVDRYDLDTLFRSSTEGEGRLAPTDARAEALHVLAKGLTAGNVSASERTYVARLVAARTGVSETEAERRVDEGITQMKAVADAARRNAELASVFSALAMLVGAFIACASAALGGRLRDLHP
jgi:hypothetical protein